MNGGTHKWRLGVTICLAAACASARPLTWQEQMDEARALEERGEAFVLVRPSEVLVFYNQPAPFCYMYRIPGEWVAKGGNTYESKDGRTTVVVGFGLPQEVSGLEGVTLVERAGSYVTRDYEKALGKPIHAALTPFASERVSTWKWTAGIEQGPDRRIDFPTKVIVDLSPDAFALITVSDSSLGTENSDRLAREIVDSLKTNKSMEGFWPTLEATLKASSPNDGG